MELKKYFKSRLEKILKPDVTTRGIGNRYELAAQKYFCAQGWKLEAKNFRGKSGEIDLIFREPRGSLVFVEVKYRRSQAFGGGYAAVNRKKQQRIGYTAIEYIKLNQLYPTDYRFDIAAVSPGGIEHIVNAFTVEGFTI